MSGIAHSLSQMALPILGLIGLILFMVVAGLLKASEDNKKAAKGRVWAFIMMQNMTIWDGLCEYSDGKVKAPWNKGEDNVVKKEDKIQVFTIDGKHTYHKMWPPGNKRFQVMMPVGFFEEQTVGALLPYGPCTCGHAECESRGGMGLTPTELGRLSRQTMVEAAIKASQDKTEVQDLMVRLLKQLPPAWVMYVGFAVMIIALAVVGFFVYQQGGNIGDLTRYLLPTPEVTP